MRVENIDRNQIIKEFLPKIGYIVKSLKHENLPPIVDEEDLIQVGVLGLIDAINKYDPSKGVKLATYAEMRIRGHIIDHLRELDWIPRSVRSKLKNLENKITELETNLGRQAKTEEIAQYLGMDVDEYMKYAEGVMNKILVSLDSSVKDEEGEEQHLWQFIATSDDTPDKIVEENELRDILIDIIKSKLDDKERLIITLYYYEELSMKEIAYVLNLTESRISQMHTKIMLKLRKEISKYLYKEVR
ncbi:MAG: FliA/WhiG family RNA polymerase sigma factor [Hydrogenothermaceae bacterium]|nr:FliA/WhiG family RNA polymerase sigma factor [Hydrogenothermaceae bacterium]